MHNAVKTLAEAIINEPLAVTTANCPGLKHYFPMTETEGTTISDVIGDVVLTSSTITGDGSSLVNLGTDVPNTPLASGTWEPVDTGKHVVIVVVGGGTLDGFNWGHTVAASNTGIQVLPGLNRVRVTDGSVLTDQAITPLANGVTIASVKNAIGITGSVATGAANTNTATTATAANLSGKAPDAVAYNSFIEACAGVMIFHFDEAPDDTQIAAAYIADAWHNRGLKVLPPSWKGKS